MQRQVVATVLLTALLVLAGCGGDPSGVRGSGVPPSGPGSGQGQSGGDAALTTGEFATTAHRIAFSVPDFRPYNDSRGNLTVEVTVRNNAPITHEARLTLLAGTDNGTVRRSTVVSLAHNETTTRNLTFPLAHDRWAGSLRFLWSPPNQTATTRPDR